MKHKTKLNAFLVELIIVILFFALSCAVVVQLFASAHQSEELSNRKSRAMLQAQQWAEQVQASSSPDDVIQVFSAFEQEEAGGAVRLSAVFGEDWNVAGEGEGSYRVECTVRQTASSAGCLVEVDLEIHDCTAKQTLLCALDLGRYFPAAGELPAGVGA